MFDSIPFWQRTLTVMVCAAACLLPLAVRAEDETPKRVTYDDHIKSILRAKCFSCHNADDRKGELDLSSYAATREGGASGEVVVPGDSLNSLLFALVAHTDEPAMPPESPKLAEDSIELIKAWVDGGALENAGSRVARAEPVGLPPELTATPTDAPKSAPMPPRLSLQPLVHTERADVVRALAVSPWSPLLAVAAPKQVLLFHTESLQLLGVLPFPEGMPEVLRFSRNGAVLLAGGGRGGLAGHTVAWNVTTGERLVQLGDELDTVLAADISADHALVALGGPKRVVRVFSADDGRQMYEMRKHVEWIYDVRFSPDAALLASADRSGAVRVSEAWTGDEYLALKGHEPGRVSLAWRADSNLLASCGADGAVRFWEMEKGEQVAKWDAHQGGATSLAFTSDGRLVTCGKDGTTKLWSGQGKLLRTFETLADEPLRTVYCEQSGRVLTGNFVGEVIAWDAASGDRKGRLTNNPPTLQSRVEASQQRLHELQTLIAALAREQRVAEDTAAAAAELAKRHEQLDDAQRRADAARTVARLVERDRDRLDGEIGRIEARVRRLETGLPNLQEAVRRADRSVRELGGDEEVRRLEQQLRTLARRRQGQLNGAKAQLADRQAKRRALQPEIAKAEAELAAASAALETLRAEFEPYRQEVERRQAALAAARASLAAAEAQLEEAEAEVVRWQEELAFARLPTAQE
ncbi:MAG: hypothetical protein DWQ31_08505 [Planctomycetota bacterium]|nr:MAG: hypothetical protein DWQ31_08505 [Planctomycetota bacterium]